MRTVEGEGGDAIRPISDDLADLLEPDGGLSAHLDSYEPRPGQVAMLKDVIRSFREGRPLIVEAGTGIGKSLAYLLPALQWALSNEGRVIISTATIALQQQLMDKDIPLARALLGKNVKTALVKGRGNYLCFKRLAEAGTDDDLFGAGNELAALREWAYGSSSGEISDLPFRPGPGLWEKVRCEADSCPGPYCRYFEKCFFMLARRRASEASLLVSNHHLLFADIAARREGVGQDETAVLPAYQCIIFDEAHHAEAGATALFSAVLSLTSLNRLFYRLYNRKDMRSYGLLQRIAEKKSRIGELLIGEIPPLINKARAAAEILDALGRTILRDQSTLRLTGEAGELEQSRLLKPMDDLQKALVQLTGSFTDGIRELNGDESDVEIRGMAMEARQTVSGLQEAVSIADSFLHRGEYADQVFWLELRRSSDGLERLLCHRTPLSVADMVRETVWESYETVIAVSATLTLADSFQHWRSRIGADSAARDFMEGIYPSPFDFSSRVMLAIPTDAPGPDNRAAWEDYLIETTAALLDLAGGHALVLFTSYETLRTTIAGVRTRLGEGAPLLLAQGDDDRGRLLKRFREHSSSVLFATDSFWEGVDVPGEALRSVVLTRLPFRPPTDPIDEARREAVAAEGGNPFLEFTVPAAVTRFRQGFGRLMRQRDDYGAVLVLDPRIVRKPYGKLFFDALPPTFQSIKPTEAVLRELEDFLFPIQ